MALYSLISGVQSFSLAAFLPPIAFSQRLSPEILHQPATTAFSQGLSPKILQSPAVIAFSQHLSPKIFLIAHSSFLSRNPRTLLFFRVFRIFRGSLS
jgi:hypothetical protein